MIIRHERGDKPFTVVTNEVIRDERLSFRARGVLIWLLSNADSWEASADRTHRHGTEGRDAVRVCFQELEAAGYMTRQRVQVAGPSGGKVWNTVIVVHDSPTTDFQSSESQASGNQASESQSSESQSSGFKASGNQASKEALTRSNKKNEQQEESKPVRDFVSRQEGVVVPLPVQPITSNQDVLAYLQKQIGIACRDHDLPRPGSVNKPAALGRLKQIRNEGLTVEDLVELTDLYVKAPTLWNSLTHPVMDFVTGTTQARLRNRRHEIRVTTSDPKPAPLRNEKAWAALHKFAEGSD